MSHCTKFDFNYSNEESIVKTFRKLNLACYTDIVSEFSSEFNKRFLGKLGFLGKKQYRAICGQNGPYNIFLCKISENNYELFIESSKQAFNDKGKIKGIADDFRRAYIETAMEEVVEKLEKGNMPSKMIIENDHFEIKFGPSLEYKLLVSFDQGKITEEVVGIKGDFCTRLTEDIERILSTPSTPLMTEWKQEFSMTLEDKNVQVLSLNF